MSASLADERFTQATQLTWWRFCRHKLALISLFIVVAFYLIAIFADFLAIAVPHTTDARRSYIPPQGIHFFDDSGFNPHVSGMKGTRDLKTFKLVYVPDPARILPVTLFAHGYSYNLLGLIPTDIHLIGLSTPQPIDGIFLLGSDQLGRDLFSRLIVATRVSLSIGLVGLSMSLMLGILLGGVSGLYGGFVDTLIQRVIEVVRSITTIPLWMGLAAALPNTWTVTQVYFAITLIISRGDAEFAKWMANADFRRALSIAIDRDQLNQSFWLGLFTPGSGVPSELMPESPGKEWIGKWLEFDPARASAMLDAIGLTRKDSEGYRLRTDNGERLRIQIDVAQTLNPSWPQQVEMVIQQWRAVGIAGDLKVLERSLFFTRVRGDQHQMVIFSNSGSDSLFLFPNLALPVDPSGSLMGSAYSQWYASGGMTGLKPAQPEMLRIYDMMRSAPSHSEVERNALAHEIWRIVADQEWQIGLVGQAPGSQGTRVVSDRLENVPTRVCISQHCRPPWSARPEQWFYK